MTAPARSVFAQALAQARANTQHVSYSPRAGAPHTPDCPGCKVDAALDLIEQRAADMEKALREVTRLRWQSDRPALVRLEAAHDTARAALSAREEAS